jgi:hypothetical protein
MGDEKKQEPLFCLRSSLIPPEGVRLFSLRTTTMPKYKTFRDFHLWAGLILMVPILVIAVTGFLWNHEKALGLKPEEYRPNRAAKKKAHPSAGKLTASPETWTAHALSIEAALTASKHEWGKEVPIERIELKQEPGIGVVVKIKAAREAGVRPEEIVWSVEDQMIVEKKGDPAKGTEWNKVVHDLHTGKFFSERFGFLWSDSGALALVLLGVTGIVLYVIPLRKRLAKRNKTTSPATPPALTRAAESGDGQTADLVKVE